MAQQYNDEAFLRWYRINYPVFNRYDGWGDKYSYCIPSDTLDQNKRGLVRGPKREVPSRVVRGTNTGQATGGGASLNPALIPQIEWVLKLGSDRPIVYVSSSDKSNAGLMKSLASPYQG